MVKQQVPLDGELWKRVTAVASSTGRSPEDIVEAAVRSYLTHPGDILDRLSSREGLSDEDAMRLAADEIHEMRRAR